MTDPVITTPKRQKTGSLRLTSRPIVLREGAFQFLPTERSSLIVGDSAVLPVGADTVPAHNMWLKFHPTALFRATHFFPIEITFINVFMLYM